MAKIKIYIIFIALTLYSFNGFAQLTVSGAINEPYKYQEELDGSGIEAIYLINTFIDAKINYQSDAGFVRFFKYTYSIADSQQVPNTDIQTSREGNTTKYTISNLEDGKGYYAEINGAVTAAIWIIDYSKHRPTLKSINPDETTEDCEYLKLIIDKEDDLFFYTNSGGKRRITRKYSITYNDMVWNSTTKTFDQKVITTNPSDIGTEFVIQAPLEDTNFLLTGDQFAEWFKETQSIESKIYSAIATSAYIVAEQDTEEGTTDNIGGSAPANVHFYAKTNEPTTYFYTWNIYKKNDLENAIVRYTDKNISYVFKESGDYEVVLEVANKNSNCVNTVSIDLSITEFSWDVPNFLLLDGEHEFKISYKSIIEFQCTIFNRWGNEIYSWKDPSKGWNGKYKGKYVSPGVYFYVMTATSGDGKKHKKAGDINILKKK